MKPIKMFGLAVLAALLAMTFIGGGSAMAENTALCLEDEDLCEEPITHVHEATLSGAKSRLLNSSNLEVECDVLFLGDALGEGLGAPLVIHGEFTYSNCSFKCEAEEENGPTEIRVLRTGTELATVTSGTGGGSGLVHLICNGIINCRFVGSGLVGHGLGALTSSELNGSVTIAEQTVTRESGSLCPATAKLDITTTPLEKTYIEKISQAEDSALCTADENPCEEENQITHVHESTLSGAKARLLNSSLEVQCNVLFLGDALSGLGNPLVIHGSFTYTNCTNSCTATEENGPTEIRVLRTGTELATVTSGTGAGAGLVHLFCFGFINCRYVGEGLKAHALGTLTSSELNGSVTISEQTVNRESGSLCPATSKLDITTTPLEKTYISS